MVAWEVEEETPIDSAAANRLSVQIPEVPPGAPPQAQFAYQNNNPGNLRNTKGDFIRYNSPEEGYGALQSHIKERANAGETLEKYLSRYAPPSENDTETYIKNATSAIGADRKTPLSQIDHSKLAQFQANQESSSKVWEVESETPVKQQPSWEIESETLVKQAPQGPGPQILAEEPPHARPAQQGFINRLTKPQSEAIAQRAFPPHESVNPLTTPPDFITEAADQLATTLGNVPGVREVIRSSAGLASPLNLATMATMGPVLSAAAKVPALAPTLGTLLGGYFGTQAGKQFLEASKERKEAWDKKDYPALADALAKEFTAAVFAGAGAKGAIEGVRGANVEVEQAVQKHNETAAKLNALENERPTVTDETPVMGMKQPMAVRTSVVVKGYDAKGNPRGEIVKQVVNPDTEEVLHSGDDASVNEFLARQKQMEGLPGGEQQPPVAAAPTPPPQAPPAAPAPVAPVIPKEGDTFDTPQGKVSVTLVSPKGVSFTREVPGGQIVQGRAMPLPVFQAMVGKPPEAPAAPVAAPGVPVPPAPIVAQPTPAPEPVQTGETVQPPAVQPPAASTEEVIQPPEATPEAAGEPETYYRGVRKGEQPGEDRFYSADQETAQEYAAPANVGGEAGTVEEVKPNDLPKKLYKADNKESLAEELGLDPKDAYKPSFDSQVKGILQAKGYAGVSYTVGTHFGQTPWREVHVFGAKKAPENAIADILGKATRKYKIGGEPMEEADPRAQLILKSLSPQDQATVNSMLSDAKNPQVLSSGFDHVVLDLGDDTVMRLGKVPTHEVTDSPYVLKPIKSQVIGQVGVEIYPKLDTSGITDKDVETVQSELQKQGLKWDDAAKDNLGRDSQGNLKIIDGQVQKAPPSISPQDAFRMGGKQLQALADTGDAGAKAELDRRAAKKGKPNAPTPQPSGLEGGAPEVPAVPQAVGGGVPSAEQKPVVPVLPEGNRNQAGAPKAPFKEGDRVTWTDAQGKKHVGSVGYDQTEHTTDISVTEPDPVMPNLRRSHQVPVADLSRTTEAITPAREAPKAAEPSYSSIQVNLPAKYLKAFKDATEGIAEDDLVEKGREDEGHITLKYGIHTEEPAAVKKLLKDEGPITATIGKVSIFEAPKYDVVKLDIESPDLHRLNKAVADAVETTDTHPTYQPHATLAYVKKGEGAKYVGKSVPGLTGQTITFDQVHFSDHDENKTAIPLKDPAQMAKDLEDQFIRAVQTEHLTKDELDQVADIFKKAEKPEKSSSGQTEQPPVETQLEPPKKMTAAEELNARNAKSRSEDGQKTIETKSLPAETKAAEPETKPHDFKKGEEVQWEGPNGTLSGRIMLGPGADSLTVRVIQKDAEGKETGRENVTVPTNAPGLRRYEPPEEISKSGETGAESLADAVYEKLKAGGSLGNVTEFNKLAEQHFGSGRASGQWTPKDAFDAMEAGINKHLIDRGADLLEMPHDEAMKELRDLMDRVTSQGVRTEEQIAAQQFSTPPTEAYTVAKVANLKPGDISMEPSAGNGGLAVYPKSIGLQTYVNEISERRRRMLEHIGFGIPTAHDGEIINALLDPAIKPTVILMNPPFSAGTVKSGVAANKNVYGFNHVDSALQRLAPGGRLVAILGGGRADDMNGGATLLGGPSGKWFQGLAKRYNIRANIRINGKEYQKYGTNFATRIIVIDKDGPTPSRVAETPSWDSVVRGVANTLEEAYTLLKDVAKSRPEIGTVRLPSAAGTRVSQPGAAQGGIGKQPSGSGGRVLPSGGGVGPAGAVGRGPGRPAAGGTVNVSQPSGEPTDLRQPGTEPTGVLQTPTVGTPESRAEDVNAERPLSDTTTDLAASTGLTPQQIIAAATKALAEKTGRKPISAPETPPGKPKTAISSAADAARDRLRAKLGNRPPGEEPVRMSADFTIQNAPVDPQDLIDLATIGAEHMIGGAVEFDPWKTALTNDVGDLIEAVAQQAGQSFDDVLRQVHQYATAVADQFGVKVPPTPPATTSPKELSGQDSQQVPLTLERNEIPKSEVEDTDAYVEYQPTIKGPEHPGAIVETKTMATVPLPPLTYKPHLPSSVVEKGGLSAVQLEAIAIAGQQNDNVLPGGARGSALIGDGTGVGKGRISAGILWDNWRQGRKRLVWVSEKWDLMQDAMRDLEGIGAKELLAGNDRKANGQFAVTSTSRVRPFAAWKAGEKIKHEGVMFSTYALIRSESKTGQRRAAQLEEYLRGDDNGEGAYILFDESHNLKNAVVGQGGEASQIGRAVKDLLANVPKLRTVSLSATAATDVMNLGYLDRLGLWGPGTAFPTGFQEFASQIAGGRLAAMEMIARELKAQGKYLSRTLSFKGVSYEEQEHVVNEDQKAIYRTAANAWKAVVQQAEHTIMDTTNGGSRQKSRFMAQLGAAQQRFFNLLITALKTPTAVELTNKALAEGKSVVITLVNTNEAAQNRERNRAATGDDEDEIPDYDFGPKQSLIDLVREHFPVQQYRDDVDDNGNPIKVPVYTVDSEGREIPVNNPDAVAARDGLIKEIDENLHMPENPLDILINSLGGGAKVAELTGRKERFDSSVGKFVPRGDPTAARKDVNLFEMRAFQGGKKRIAILSGAAGTGISLHAGNDVANQQQRYHLTLQVGWSADKQMQMFGRTHRTNQKQPPQYVMLVSDLGGEKRFVSTIARRLGSLGAITKGQKNATSGTDLMEKVNFETQQGSQATNAFYEQLLRNNPVPGTNLTGMQVLTDLRMLEGDPPTVPQRHRQNVTRLLNRLLAIDPDHQNAAYNYFYEIFQAAVQRAIEQGTLDTGVKALPGDTFDVTEQRVLAKDPKTGAETFYYPVDAQVRTHRVSPEDLDRWMKTQKTKNPRIVRGKDDKLVMAFDADPIVHASGSVEDASYTVAPHRGRVQKVGNRTIGGEEVGEWAKDELEKAQSEVASNERSLGYRQESAKGTEDWNRSRLPEAERAAYKLPEDNWQARNVAEAEKELDESKEALAKAELVANDPELWARNRWQELYDAAPSHITERHHLVGGAVMKYWNPVREASGLADIYTTTDSKTGKRVVGIDIPAEGINQLLSRIGGGQSTVSTHQLFVDVMRNNLTYNLEGGIIVRRGRVGRDTVIQLIPPSQAVAQNLKTFGVIAERGVTPIYYVPNNSSGPRETHTQVILGKIVEEYPIQTQDGGDEPTRESKSGEMARESRATPGFYSQMERTLSSKMPNKASAQQVLGILKSPNNGVKEDEIKWSGIQDWLKEQGDKSLSKDDVLAFVKSNEVQLQEVTRGTPDTKDLDARIRELASGRTPQELETARRPEDQPELDRLLKEWDEADKNMPPTKFGQYTTPGGQNYRELLLTLPVDQNKAQEAKSARVKELIARRDDLQEQLNTARALNTPRLFEQLTRNLNNTNTQIDMVMREPAEKSGGIQYKSSHWDEPNVLAHVRFDDREGPNGEKILHVAEIQSDWHQAGKRKGYRTGEKAPAPVLTVERNGPSLIEVGSQYSQNGTNTEGSVVSWKDSGWEGSRRDFPTDAYGVGGRGYRGSIQDEARNFETEDEALDWVKERVMDLHQRIANQRAGMEAGVPQAPFAKSWPELALKRVIRYAAEHGYDAITWDRGETQADRYDLSKQISRVEYDPQKQILVALDKQGTNVMPYKKIAPEELPDYIGKDVANKLLESPMRKRAGEEITGKPAIHVLSGVDLRVGGEGMKGFYDKILPDFARKYAKKWGATVGTAELTGTGPNHVGYYFTNGVDNSDGYDVMEGGETDVLAHFKTEDEAQKYIDGLADKVTVHHLPITPAMRESVMQGQPLFMKGQNLESNEPVKARFRKGVLWVNSKGMRQIAEHLNLRGTPNGIYVPPKLAESLVFLGPGAKAGESVVAVRMDPGQSWSQAKAGVRHELFHATEEWSGNGSRGQQLRNEPLAQKAVIGLLKQGYSNDVAMMFSEIGAHLASGPVGWKTMGITPEEAKELFQKYVALLSDKVVSKLDRIAPQLKQELYAEQAIRESALSLDAGSGEELPGSPQGQPAGPTRGSLGKDVPGEKESERTIPRQLPGFEQHRLTHKVVASYGERGSVRLNLTAIREGIQSVFGGKPKLDAAALKGLDSKGSAGTELRGTLEDTFESANSEDRKVLVAVLKEQIANFSPAEVKELSDVLAVRSYETIPKVWDAYDLIKGVQDKADRGYFEPVEPEPVAAEPKPAGDRIRRSTLASKVETQAIANKLTEGFEGLPEYKMVSVAEQAQKAQELLQRDPETAIRIAMGEEVPPHGLLPESVFVAVENHATENRDVDLIRRLATESTRSMEATGMGQRIRMLGERNQNSPVASIQKVVKAREETAEKRHGKKAKEQVKGQIKDEIKKKQKKDEWNSFIESLRCQ